MSILNVNDEVDIDKYEPSYNLIYANAHPMPDIYSYRPPKPKEGLFDTTGHEIFLMKLECMGFGRSTILWFKSYLNNRTFQVNIEDEYS